MTKDALLGKWKLLKAGNESPSALKIKSHEIEFRADGSWSAVTEMQGAFAGMKLNFGGNWSLTDAEVSYTAGADSGKARVSIASDRLTFGPDFVIRKDGTVSVLAEYHR